MQNKPTLKLIWQRLVDIAAGRWQIISGDLLADGSNTLEGALNASGIARSQVAVAEVQLRDARQFGDLSKHYDVLFPDTDMCPVRTPFGNKDLPEGIFARVYLLIAPDYINLQHINLHTNEYTKRLTLLDDMCFGKDTRGISIADDRDILYGLSCLGRYSLRVNVKEVLPSAFFTSAQASDDTNIQGNVCHNYTKIDAVVRVIPHPGQRGVVTNVVIHHVKGVDARLEALAKGYFRCARVHLIEVDSLPFDSEQYLITTGGKYY